MNDIQAKNRRVAKISAVAAIAMFGFGFALIPLYNVFCDVFSFNGSMRDIEKGKYKIQEQAEKAMRQGVDKDRLVTMQFHVTDNPELNLDFRALVNSVDINPGAINEVKYFVKNLTDRPLEIQAIPEVTPANAKKYLAKVECFCFTKQTLKPGEEREMPLRFVVNSALPQHIPVMTMTYRFIDLQRSAALGNETIPAARIRVQQGETVY